jgi:hypothetical protein
MTPAINTERANMKKQLTDKQLSEGPLALLWKEYGVKSEESSMAFNLAFPTREEGGSFSSNFSQALKKTMSGHPRFGSIDFFHGTACSNPAAMMDIINDWLKQMRP